jgi:hypothetical protein
VQALPPLKGLLTAHSQASGLLAGTVGVPLQQEATFKAQHKLLTASLAMLAEQFSVIKLRLRNNKKTYPLTLKNLVFILF